MEGTPWQCFSQLITTYRFTGFILIVCLSLLGKAEFASAQRPILTPTISSTGKLRQDPPYSLAHAETLPKSDAQRSHKVAQETDFVDLQRNASVAVGEELDYEVRTVDRPSSKGSYVQVTRKLTGVAIDVVHQKNGYIGKDRREYITVFKIRNFSANDYGEYVVEAKGTTIVKDTVWFVPPVSHIVGSSLEPSTRKPNGTVCPDSYKGDTGSSACCQVLIVLGAVAAPLVAALVAYMIYHKIQGKELRWVQSEPGTQNNSRDSNGNDENEKLNGEKTTQGKVRHRSSVPKRNENAVHFNNSTENCSFE